MVRRQLLKVLFSLNDIYPFEKIVEFDVGTDLATTSNLPEQTAGTLITHRSNGSYWGYQEYKIYQKNRYYTRFWDGDAGAWKPWEKSNVIVSDESAIVTNDSLYNTLPMEYKNRLVVTRIGSNESAGFPMWVGGILITNGCFGGWYAYQEYHPVNSTKIYKRYVVNNNTWSAWQLVGGPTVVPQTFDFGTINANSTKEFSIDRSGVAANTPITAQAYNGIEAGLILSWYCVTNKIYVRIDNVTSSPKTVGSKEIIVSILPS